MVGPGRFVYPGALRGVRILGASGRTARRHVIRGPELLGYLGTLR